MGWIATLAFWEIKSERDRRRRERARAGDARRLETQVAAGASPEEALESAQLVELLHEAAGELSATDLETLRAYAGNRRPTGATYRKRLERALARLGRVWRSRHG